MSKGGFLIRIRITLGSWIQIRIRIRVKKLNPAPHYSENAGALKAKNGAVEGCGPHNRDVEVQIGELGL
jgi:hypothetical protein